LDDINEEEDVPQRFKKITYGKNDGNDFASKEAVKIINCGAAKGLGHAAIGLAQPSVDYALYKNLSFADEQEWRVVCKRGAGQGQMILSESLKVSPKLYRNSGEQIVSYVEMDFSSIKTDIIKEIRIGPKSKVTEDDVVNLLADSGYYANIGDHSEKPIPIIPSKSTYR
jgi:hypothetical protein